MTTSPSAGHLLGGRYRLETPLGSGATATVWRARDAELGREVAVKVLTGTGVPAELAGRFGREGVILARLEHPNLVRVLASGEEDGTPFLVMDLVDGSSLRQILAHGPLRADEAVAIIAQVASGLGVAHAAGIVHRDATPANILLDQSGTPVVVDFGIARASDLTSMTSVDIVMGTAAYFAPEQAQGKDVSPATDVYALGCVLTELLTGQPPYQADSPVALAFRHVHDPVVSLRDRDPDASLPLTTVVAACLAKDPAARYTDGAELAADLRRVQRGEPVLGPVGATPGDGDATVAVAALVTPTDGTMILPAAAAAGAGAGPITSTVGPAGHRSRRWVVAGAVAILTLLLTAVALANGGDGNPPAQAETTTTDATTTTTTAPPPPPVEDDDEDRGKGKGRGKDDDD